MSRFNAYLKTHDLTFRAFAVQVGVDPSIVSKLAAGKIRPSLLLAARIERATTGEVSAVGWVEDLLKPPPPAVRSLRAGEPAGDAKDASPAFPNSNETHSVKAGTS